MLSLASLPPLPKWCRTKIDRVEEAFAHVVTHHRWIFVILFLLPLSFCYDVFWRIRIQYQMLRTKHAPHLHQQRVANVQRQVKEWIASGSKTPMCTARPGWLTVSLRVGNYKKTHHAIDVNMNDILHVDTERRIVRCEPQVTMGQLTACLIPMGWTLAVVPELDDLTVGGLINGFGVETSSFRYGLFQHICTAYEIVLPTGECVIATKDQHTDLFRTIPWSYGTLGFLVSADIQIVPAKKYVHIQYLPFTNLHTFTSRLESEARRTDADIDFIEALQFSHDTGVVMPAKMTDEIPKKGCLNEIGRWYKPWFFTHVASKLSTPEPKEEWIPLRDYYHRHSRSIFWEIQDIIPFGNHPIFRYALGWMVPPKISLLKLTTTPALKRLYTLHHVVQDMLIPITETKHAIEIFHDEFHLYPLWHCPMKIVKGQDGLLSPLPSEEMFIDIGAYGNPTIKNWDVKASLRRVEKYVRQVRGFQALYADTYMTRDEFREMFDHTLYDRVRKQVGAVNAFPEIYDKVSLAARH